jgi:flagellar basal-body rod protein FlgC
MFNGLQISASGMHAQRLRQNVISSNLANAETTRTEEGGPYRRQFVVFKAASEGKDTRIVNRDDHMQGRSTHVEHMPIPPSPFVQTKAFFGNGVEVAEVRKDTRPPKMVHDPSHPDADPNGYVAKPNINPIKEMTNMIAATRAYEANVTAFNASKSMIMKALEI